MEAGGIKTAYYQVYPAETTDFNPIADKIIASKADVVVAGTFLPDITAFMQRFQATALQPPGADRHGRTRPGRRFPEGHWRSCQCGRHHGTAMAGIADSNNPGNAEMVKAYIAKYGGTADEINGDVAEGYSVGQVVQQVVRRIKASTMPRSSPSCIRAIPSTVCRDRCKFDDDRPEYCGEGIPVPVAEWGVPVPVYPPQLHQWHSRNSQTKLAVSDRSVGFTGAT